jgi:exodeoxyribonuclease VII large subunit
LRTLIASERRSLDLSGRRAAQALSRLVAFQRQRFDGLAKLADSLSYKSVLRRGFALVRDEQGHPVHAASSVKQWQPLRLEFADGEVSVREDSARQGRLL